VVLAVSTQKTAVALQPPRPKALTTPMIFKRDHSASEQSSVGNYRLAGPVELAATSRCLLS
jgi:hypothetical protein